MVKQLASKDIKEYLKSDTKKVLLDVRTQEELERSPTPPIPARYQRPLHIVADTPNPRIVVDAEGVQRVVRESDAPRAKAPNESSEPWN